MSNWYYRHNDTWHTIRGKTYREAWVALARELRVDGPRALRAARADGAMVQASLYDGEDYAKTARGKRVDYLLDR